MDESQYKRKYYLKNRTQLLEKMKEWRKANPEYFKSYNSAYYLANKEELNRKGKIWRLSNIDKERAANKNWREANKERKKESGRNWQKNNPDKVNAAQMRHYSAKLQAIPKWANHEAIDCYYEFASLKSSITGEKWEVDHIVPLQSKIVCGLHTDWNLQVITKKENIAKRNHYWPDMP